MGALALFPVQSNSVEHRVGDNKQSGRFKLRAETVNVKHNDTLIKINIGLLTEDVKGTGRIKLQRQCNLLCFGFGLFKQHITERTERRNRTGFCRIAVHVGNTTVDDGLMLRADAFLVNLLNEGHDELRLYDNRIVLAVAVNHIHGVQSVSATGRYADHRAEITHCFNKRRVFTFRIADQNIIISIQHEKGNQFLCRERLAGAGNAEEERRLVQKVCFVAHDEVMGNGVFSEEDAALIHDLLHLKRHKHRKAFRCQRSERIDLAQAVRKNGIQSVRLLIFQGRHLAHVLSRS